MKKLYAALLALVLLAVAVVPVLAAPEAAKGPRGTFSLVGNITAIGADSITVSVVSGNTLVKPYIDQEVTVTVTASTRYLLKDDNIVSIITFGDLQIGQAVSINGTLASNVWTAKRVTAGASLSCLP